jgi:hypothetical protein
LFARFSGATAPEARAIAATLLQLGYVAAATKLLGQATAQSPAAGTSRDHVEIGGNVMPDQEKRQRKPAIGYTRTSSPTNLGEGKDSVVRQRKAIQAYANRSGYRVVAW